MLGFGRLAGSNLASPERRPHGSGVFLAVVALAAALPACGGGSSPAGGGGSMRLSLRWEEGVLTSPQTGDFGTPVPPAANVARVIFTGSDGNSCCIAFRPRSSAFSASRRIVLLDLVPGAADIAVAAYPGDFAPADGVAETCAAEPPSAVEPCTDGSAATSFRGETSVNILAGLVNEAGEIPFNSTPFIVGSIQTGSAENAPFAVAFTVADAGAGVDEASVEVTARQGAAVLPGTILDFVACDDAPGSQNQCSPGGALQVSGYEFLVGIAGAMPGTADVLIEAENDGNPPQALEQGGGVGFSATVPVVLATPTRTPSFTGTASPTRTPSGTETPTETPTETETPTTTPTSTPRLSFDVVRFATDNSYVSLGLADLDVDESLDVVAADPVDHVDVFLNEGPRVFRLATAVAVAPTPVAPHSVAVGDVNGDDYPDIFTANRRSFFGAPASVSIVLSDGELVYLTADLREFAFEGSAESSGPAAIAIRDIDFDGSLDLIAGTGSTLVRIPRDVKGGFLNAQTLFGSMPPPEPLGGAVKAVVTAPLDTNGLTDFLGVTGFTKSDGGDFFLGLEMGKTLELSSTDISLATPADADIGFLGSDQTRSLAVACENSEETGNLMLRAVGDDGALGPPIFIETGGGPAVSAAIGFFDDDGIADVAVVDGSGRVSVLLGITAETFEAPLVFQGGDLAKHLKVGDLDGDGSADIVVASERNGDFPNSGGLTFFFNDNDGSSNP